MAPAFTSAVADPELASRPPAGSHRLIGVTVAANTPLAPRVRRLRLAAPEFAGFALSGPDEYFGLLMPQPGRAFVPFTVGQGNVRAIIADLPEAERPELRWYTIRRVDRAAGAIDVDIVTHGDEGPGSRWVLGARPGDTAGMYTCSGIWSRPVPERLLVADATAVPALRAVLEFLAVHHPHELRETHAAVFASSDSELEPGLAERWAPELGTLREVRAPVAHHRDELARILDDWTALGHPASRVGYVWAGGEADFVKTARTVAVKRWGLDSERAAWATYWIRGRPRP